MHTGGTNEKQNLDSCCCRALALPAAAWAQGHFTPVTTQTLMSGLNSGRPMVITTPLASGYLQTVSFVAPSGPMPQAKAAQLIQLAQKDLAKRGIETPTALQIAVTLLGARCPRPTGDFHVPGLRPRLLAQRRFALAPASPLQRSSDSFG